MSKRKPFYGLFHPTRRGHITDLCRTPAKAREVAGRQFAPFTDDPAKGWRIALAEGFRLVAVTYRIIPEPKAKKKAKRK